MAWDRLTYPETLGGMEFRDFHNFNMATMAKQGWNIMTRPHTLVAKIYKARYFPNTSFFLIHNLGIILAMHGVAFGNLAKY
jgi:hypothetical protein